LSLVAALQLFACVVRVCAVFDRSSTLTVCGCTTAAASLCFPLLHSVPPFDMSTHSSFLFSSCLLLIIILVQSAEYQPHQPKAKLLPRESDDLLAGRRQKGAGSCTECTATKPC